MLSEVEKNGIRSLLQRLTKEDLISLTDTVTNRAVTVETCKDAIEAILSFTMNVKVLLRRKKVRREHVFQYLAENQVFVPGAADKQQLIKKVMELWEIKEKELKSGGGGGGSGGMVGVGDCEYPGDPSVSSTSQDLRVTSIEPASSTTSPGHSPKTSSPAVCSSGDDKKNDTDDYGQKYAEQWTPWFYDLLRQCGTNMIHDPLQPHGMSDWGEHHFWADAVLKIEVTARNQTTEENYSGALNVSRRLYSLVVRESIYLNPNLDRNGIKGRLEHTGMVLVTASGTVHRHSHFVGIFSQAFGLLRDPSVNNNYRIKFTNLQLRSTDYMPHFAT